MNQNVSLLRRLLALSGAVLMILVFHPAFSQTVSVLTQHNDLSRSGSNPNETILNTSNVNGSTFGKLFSLPIDGFTYAQPLYDPDISIAGGIHNVLYVATAHDSVYAFDADSGTQYWKVSLGTPVPSSVINTPNIQVEVGIISTPVIDPSSDTIFVVAKTYENSAQIFRLHALDISTGAEKFGGPVEISASVSGSGQQSSGGKVPFVASQENQRGALTLANGVVYVAFASHEDHSPYHGWVLGYNTGNLQQVQVFNVTPNSGEGAIWMGGQGFVVDSSNNLYLITSNSSQSTENASNDYGESFLKLVPNGSSLTVGDYFKAHNYDSLNAGDVDLGSTGAFAIPGTTYIAGGSKSGMFYVVNTSNMGKLNTSSDQIVQEFQATNGLWGSAAFFNNTMYIWGVNEPLKAYKFSGGKFNTSPSSKSAYAPPGGTTSGSVSVSSNGTTAGTAIVWGTSPTGDPDHATVGGNLYAYDATNLGTLLWSTSQNSSRDSYGEFAKFDAPTIANGKVYVGTDSKRVVVYGLLSGGGGGGNLIANGTYAVTNVNSGQAIDDPGFSTVDGKDLQQYSVNGGSNQNWTVNNLGNDVITLANGASGQFMDVVAASKANNALVDQWPSNSQTNQQWNVISLGGGHFELTSVNSGLALEVVGGSTAIKAGIDQNPYQGNSWQQWIFTAK
jgi:outer membrane protein assembly factor BamB